MIGSLLSNVSGSGAGPRSPLLGGSDVVAGVLLASMSVVAVLGYSQIFERWAFVSSSSVAAAGALAVGLAGRRLAQSSGVVVLASLAALAVVGVITTQGIPTPNAVGSFTGGLIGGWADILSTLPPLPMTSDLVVLPFVTAWLGTMIGVELLRRRLPGLAGAGPVAGFVLTILMTFESRTLALIQGSAIAVGVLVLAFIQQRRAVAPTEPAQAETVGGLPPIGGLLRALVVIAVVAVAAPAIGPRLPLADSNERFDLRRYQTPPFDPLREPTPLVQVKAALQAKNADLVVFTVSADEPISRFPVAVLDHYTNEFWSVVDESTDAPAQFLPIGSSFPEPLDGAVTGWRPLSASIEIRDLDRLSGGDFDQPWLPTIGWPVTVKAEQPLDLRFNPSTGTVAVAPDGPDSGTVYTVDALVPPAIEDVELAAATVTSIDRFDLAVPQMESFAADTLEGTNGGWDAVEAIRKRLVDTGAYDSREASASARSGHSLGRLAEFVDGGRTVGFEEHYAATAALIARNAGIPARVVVGFAVPPEELEGRWVDKTLEVRANDIAAWLEVRFDGIGWMPFDVTPPRDRAPEDRPTGRTQRRVAEPNPPPTVPPPALPPRLQDTGDADEDLDDDEVSDDGRSVPWTAIAVGGAVGSPFLVLGFLAAAVLWLKRRRRRRRRTHSQPGMRVAGAWFEIIDRLRELGVSPPPSATPSEFVRGAVDDGIIESQAGSVLIDLVRDVERAAYHPDPTDQALAEVAWRRSDLVASELLDGVPTMTRWRARLDPTPLFGADPVGTDTIAIDVTDSDTKETRR